MLFSDSKSNIDKQALRQFIVAELIDLRQKQDELIHGNDNRQFWEGFHNQIVNSDEKEELVKVEEQLMYLGEFIDKWIEMAVESDERFEFFILSKAEELNTGDQQKDYFWALQIRHDQLVGLVEVIKALVDHLGRLVEMEPKEALEDGVIAGMSEKTIEDQVYLEAESIHKQREAIRNG